jgi:tRNA(fMet)-specific endonuclease VapC
MIRYLLDTNAVIAALNPHADIFAHRIRQHHPDEIGLSAVVIYELFYGAFKSQRTEYNLAIVDNLQFEIIEFDKEDARQAGEIRAHLTAKGMPIAPYDVMIAGQAKARNLTLVTNNTKEFLRVPKLSIENWLFTS